MPGELSIGSLRFGVNLGAGLLKIQALPTFRLLLSMSPRPSAPFLLARFPLLS